MLPSLVTGKLLGPRASEVKTYIRFEISNLNYPGMVSMCILPLTAMVASEVKAASKRP